MRPQTLTLKPLSLELENQDRLETSFLADSASAVGVVDALSPPAALARSPIRHLARPQTKEVLREKHAQHFSRRARLVTNGKCIGSSPGRPASPCSPGQKEHRTPHFRHLDLQGNNIGDEGTRALAGILRKILQLEFLDVSSCGMGTPGASHLGQNFRHLPSPPQIPQLLVLVRGNQNSNILSSAGSSQT